MNKSYQLGLLYLTHLLVSVDGVVDENEKAALLKVKETEKISDEIFAFFTKNVEIKSERIIYNEGLDFLNECTPEEKLRAFTTLYRISEVDGRVHVKEVRLLLYSMRFAGIDFDSVVEAAKKFPSFNQ